jgi:type VI secretion system protein ImpC
MSETQSNESQQPQSADAAGLSLLDEIMEQTKIAPGDESYAVARRGVEAFIGEMLAPKSTYEKADKVAVDQMIAEIDRKLSGQVDQILHNENVQKLESAWRGLKFTVDRTDFRESNKIELLNISKEQILEDFEDSPEVVQSGLYKIAYTQEYGQFGGEPYAALIANYDFGPGAQDIALLQNCASVASMAHAPFIAAAGPKFFGLDDDFQGLGNLKDLESVFEGPQYTKWNGFRETEDARYVGLTCPRFLLRLPYGEDNPVKAFDYSESVSAGHNSYLWGNTSFSFATKLTESFAQYRWCPNIVGPQSGGAVDDLPLHQYKSGGATETKVPTELLISERREYEMAEQGFIPLSMRKGSDNACFFSANSAQKAKSFGSSKEGKEAELNYRLGTQLPYMFVINRLSHYIKVLQREQLGSSKDRNGLERELNSWLSQYVVEDDNPSPDVRARRPLREAKIMVEDVPGEAGWYRVRMQVRPHFKYMGAMFTLSMVGKLDKD